MMNTITKTAMSTKREKRSAGTDTTGHKSLVAYGAVLQKE